MLNRFVVLALSAAALTLLVCSSPNNPYQDRKNTNISSIDLSSPSPGQSARRVGDTLTATANLFAAQYIDSVVIGVGGYWDTVIANNGGWTTNESVAARHRLDSAGATSIKVTIYVNDGREITSQTQAFDVKGLPPTFATDLPSHVGLVEGQTLSLHIVAAGTGPFVYDWTKSGDTISAATGATYTAAHVSIADTGTYRCIVDNAWGTAMSGNAVVTIGPPGTQPAPRWVHDTIHVSTFEGNSFSLSLIDSCSDSNTSAALTVSIPRDTVLRARISGDTILLLAPGRGDSGTYFMPVVVSDGVAKDTALVRVAVKATRVTLTKQTPVNGSITVSPDQTSFRYGDTATITAMPGQSYEFDSWLGTLAGKPATAVIVMFTDTMVAARFIPVAGCTSLPSGSSINQAISQASKAVPRNTVFCLDNEGTYEGNTVHSHGVVKITVR